MGSADVAEYFVKLAKRFQVPYLVILDKDRVATDRTTLRKIASASGAPLTPPDEHALQLLTERVCRTQRQATQWRVDAEGVLEGRNVYCLGNDIEGAIAFSYGKDVLLNQLGPENVKHLSAQSVAELTALQGSVFRGRLRQLVGSKGWNNDAANNAQKLKPHAPRAAIDGLGRPRANSDLAALVETLERFMSA
jgi:hypothetical protein